MNQHQQVPTTEAQVTEQFALRPGKISNPEPHAKKTQINDQPKISVKSLFTPILIIPIRLLDTYIEQLQTDR
ncbi:hypothetical protein GCM10027180_13500 [Microbulbifer echini]